MSPAMPTATARVRCPEATIFVRLAWENEKPAHLFIFCGKAGSAAAALCDALSRVASRLLRAGASVASIAEMLSEISHDRTNGSDEARSIPDGVAKGLRLIEEEQNGLAR